ncbi:MAG: hypothetical protein ACC645_18590, partial [Pirellulales bacterium]
MSEPLTRRALLGRAGATAGLFAAGGVRRLWAAPAAGAVAPNLPVAIQGCDSYEPRKLAGALAQALGLIGGIERLVQGKTVTIKLNLTGGPRLKLGGLPARRTYHVHPQFVAAACAAIRGAGARRIVLVESGYDRRPLEEVMAGAGWNIDRIAAAGDGKVSWEDTRNEGRWRGYSRLQVPWGGYVYPAFDLNRRYEKTDVFVSL